MGRHSPWWVELSSLIVDNFLSNPEVLVEYAAQHCSFEGVSDAFYPGRRAKVPPIYSFAVRAVRTSSPGSALRLIRVPAG